MALYLSLVRGQYRYGRAKPRSIAFDYLFWDLIIGIGKNLEVYKAQDQHFKI